MAEESYPFGTSQVATELQWSRMARNFQVDGVVADDPTGTSLKVTANGTAQVTVAAGEGFVNGFYYRNSSDKLITVTNNASGATRLDRIVLRASMTGDIVSAVHSPGGTSAPALTQNRDDIYEIPLAQFSVANGGAAVLASSVVDQRYFVGKPARPSNGANGRPAPLRGQFLVEGTATAPIVLVGSGTSWIQVFPIPVPSYVNLPLVGGFTQFGGGFDFGQYAKLPGGLVSVRGLLKANSTKVAPYQIGVLPAGFRPANAVMFAQPHGSGAGSFGRLDVQGDGSVIGQFGMVSGDWVSLSGVTFIAEA